MTAAWRSARGYCLFRAPRPPDHLRSWRNRQLADEGAILRRQAGRQASPCEVRGGLAVSTAGCPLAPTCSLRKTVSASGQPTVRCSVGIIRRLDGAPTKNRSISSLEDLSSSTPTTMPDPLRTRTARSRSCRNAWRGTWPTRGSGALTFAARSQDGTMLEVVWRHALTCHLRTPSASARGSFVTNGSDSPRNDGNLRNLRPPFAAPEAECNTAAMGDGARASRYGIETYWDSKPMPASCRSMSASALILVTVGRTAPVTVSGRPPPAPSLTCASQRAGRQRQLGAGFPEP